MKLSTFPLVLLVVLILVSVQAYAGLIVRNTDSLGNKLIYDTDLNITWYDAPVTERTWYDSVSWALNLSVNVNGSSVTGWRLPKTVDGFSVDSYDGTTTGGYNITTSEMGHLFFIELNNKAYYDITGNYQSDHGFLNKGPFSASLPDDHPYWSGTVYSINPAYAWAFGVSNGYQHATGKGFATYALAVHEGDVFASVPEPSTLALLGIGLGAVTIAGCRRMK